MKNSYRYFFVGIWNSLFGVLAFAFLLNFAGEARHQFALAIAYVVAITHSHFTQRRFVWHSKAPYAIELLKFSTLYLAQYVINAATLFVLVDYCDVAPLLAQSSLILIFTFVMYSMNKRMIFVNKESSK